MFATEREQLLTTLKHRFEKHTARYVGLAREQVQASLEKNPTALTTLQRMEAWSGEPDVTGGARGFRGVVLV